MAAKVNRILVSTCMVCCFISLSLCQNDTNITDANTTVVTTTVPATTTTTIPPTTTTTLPPLPSSAVPANVDLGQCPCDVTGNGCDVNCLCDSDCSKEDIAAFTEYLSTSVSVDDRLCVQSQIMLLDNSIYRTETTQDGLFCIYQDNYAERNYYNIPNVVSDTATFNTYLDKYAGTTYAPTTSSSTTYSQFYKNGDPVYVVYNTFATGYLNIPQAMSSSYCADGNPVAFLKEQNFECVRRLSTLDANTCVNTAYLSASTYFSNFRVVKTPYLFSDILNSTVTTTPAPLPTTTTTTPVPTSAAASNATGGNATTTVPTTTTTVTTTVAVTTGVMSSDNVTSDNATTNNITSTTEASTVVVTTEAPPVFVDIYNNSYTIDVVVDRVECKGTSGIMFDCGFGAGQAPDPSYNGSHCENVVVGVEYRLTQDGSNGITHANVSFILDTIDSSYLPLTQSFSTRFPGVNEVDTTERSGNPGYIIGKPVRAGILPQNTSADNRWAIVENQYDLTMIKSSATGECLSDANNRVQVNFGENIRTGCLIRFNLENIQSTQYCQFMQESIIEALEGMNDTVIRDSPNNYRRVATFGNSDVLLSGDWVQILRENVPNPQSSVSIDTIDGPTCSLSMGMHIEILYAKVGALANPQSKIIGVAFKYEATQAVTYTCVGTYCAPGNALVDQAFEVSQSVTFIDISQKATDYVGEPPIFLAKVPYDFFYPFVSNSASSLRHFSICLTCVLVSLYKILTLVVL